MSFIQVLSVKLQRGDNSVSWGFNVQGGKEFHSPLVIQKVNTSSLADKCSIRPGDYILRIGSIITENLTHNQARDAIVRQGNNLELTLQRGASPRPEDYVIKYDFPQHQLMTPHVMESGPQQPSTLSPQVGIQLGSNKALLTQSYNSPMGLYSTQNIADTLVSSVKNDQFVVKTNGEQRSSTPATPPPTPTTAASDDDSRRPATWIIPTEISASEQREVPLKSASASSSSLGGLCLNKAPRPFKLSAASTVEWSNVVKLTTDQLMVAPFVNTSSLLSATPNESDASAIYQTPVNELVTKTSPTTANRGSEQFAQQDALNDDMFRFRVAPVSNIEFSPTDSTADIQVSAKIENNGAKHIEQPASSPAEHQHHQKKHSISTSSGRLLLKSIEQEILGGEKSTTDATQTTARNRVTETSNLLATTGRKASNTVAPLKVTTGALASMPSYLTKSNSNNSSLSGSQNNLSSSISSSSINSSSGISSVSSALSPVAAFDLNNNTCMMMKTDFKLQNAAIAEDVTDDVKSDRMQAITPSGTTKRHVSRLDEPGKPSMAQSRTFKLLQQTLEKGLVQHDAVFRDNISKKSQLRRCSLNVSTEEAAASTARSTMHQGSSEHRRQTPISVATPAAHRPSPFAPPPRLSSPAAASSSSSGYSSTAIAPGSVVTSSEESAADSLELSNSFDSRLRSARPSLPSHFDVARFDRDLREKQRKSLLAHTLAHHGFTYTYHGEARPSLPFVSTAPRKSVLAEEEETFAYRKSNDDGSSATGVTTARLAEQANIDQQAAITDTAGRSEHSSVCSSRSSSTSSIDMSSAKSRHQDARSIQTVADNADLELTKTAGSLNLKEPSLVHAAQAIVAKPFAAPATCANPTASALAMASPLYGSSAPFSSTTNQRHPHLSSSSAGAYGSSPLPSPSLSSASPHPHPQQQFQFGSRAAPPQPSPYSTSNFRAAPAPNWNMGPRTINRGLKGSAQLSAASPSSVPTCSACTQLIRGPFITAVNKTWCPNHFVCAQPSCGTNLQDVCFVEEAGQLYCERDYELYFAPKCYKCGASVMGECCYALDKSFHPECFTCGHCKQKIGSGSFHLEDGVVYCAKDYSALFSVKCAGCQFAIEAGDKFLEALDQKYHVECFICTTCNVPLQSIGFAAKGNKPYCRKHAY